MKLITQRNLDAIILIHCLLCVVIPITGMPIAFYLYKTFSETTGITLVCILGTIWLFQVGVISFKLGEMERRLFPKRGPTR